MSSPSEATVPGSAAGELSGGGWCVRFEHRGDRYAHEILFGADGRQQVVYASIEGTPEDDWPASPPFQSLHFEHRPDGTQLALLVGMAGKSHWSASIELNASDRSLVFDVACRVRGSAGPLGSHYRATGTLARPSFEIDERAGSARLIEDVDATAIVAVDELKGEKARTVRWCYRLQMP